MLSVNLLLKLSKCIFVVFNCTLGTYFLSEFDFRIEHRPGKLYNSVDARSRPPFVSRIPTVNLINTVENSASKYAQNSIAENRIPNKEISVNFVEHIALQGFSNQQLRQLLKEDNTLALFFDFIE